MKTIAPILTMIAACGLALPGLAQSDNLLVNGDFEDEPNFWSGGVSSDGSYTALINDEIPGWTIEPDHAVTVHICCRYPVIGGTYSVNTDGEGWHGHNANFYQDFGSRVGVSYTLAFDYQCWFINGTGTNTPQLCISVVDTVTSAVFFKGIYGYTSQGARYHVVTNFYGTGNALRLRVQQNPESGINDDEFVVDNFSVTGARFGLDWFTVDGGGGASTGAVHTFTGTVAQPDAGTLSSSNFTFVGGFWGVAVAVQTPGAPLLSIFRTTTNTVAVSWPSPSTGWTLQQNTNSVSSVNWSNVTTAIQDNGTTKTLIVNPPVGNRFYRLKSPP